MQLQDLNRLLQHRMGEVNTLISQVYFNESAEVAQKMVTEVLSKYQALLARLDEDSKGKVQRSMGLKMEQLKVVQSGQLL